MPLSLAKRLHRIAVQAPRTERLGAALAELTRPAHSLLDVGCGSGEVAREIGARMGASLVEGVDVLVQPEPFIPVTRYDGATLPFPDASFDAVLLSDVLHHAESPRALLAEALRVARAAVVVKDHFAFGPVSRRLLLAMDLAANGFYDIAVRGAYLDPSEWQALFLESGARVARLEWPLHVHAPALRVLAPSRLQFAARLEVVAR